MSHLLGTAIIEPVSPAIPESATLPLLLTGVGGIAGFLSSAAEQLFETRPG